MPLSRASTRGRYSLILGITSWYQSLLRPRSPHCLIESLTVESRHPRKMFLSPIFILESRISSAPHPLFILVRTPDDYSCLFHFQKLHQFFFRNLASIVWIVPMSLWREHCSQCLLSFRGCGSVPGSWASSCCRHKSIAAVLEYLRRPTSKTLLCG